MDFFFPVWSKYGLYIKKYSSAQRLRRLTGDFKGSDYFDLPVGKSK